MTGLKVTRESLSREILLAQEIEQRRIGVDACPSSKLPPIAICVRCGDLRGCWR